MPVVSESNETVADWPPVRRRRVIPLAALDRVRRHRLLVVALPVLVAAALAAGLIIGGGDAQPSRAAALAPSDATVFVLARRGDDAARLWEIAGGFPSLAALERDLLGPDVDPERDIRPWLGDELALALPGPLLLAAVADRAGAERFRRRLPETTASAFAGAFLAIGPNAAVNAAAARAGGEGESLADTRVYQRAGDIERAPVELYAPADGLRRLLAEAPALLRAAGAFADSPQFEGIAAGVVPEERGVRIRARILRAPGGAPAEEFAPALPARVPASAAAFLDLPGADALTALLERGGLAATVNAVRTALPEIAGVDLDRDLLRPLGSEAALTIAAAGRHAGDHADRADRRPGPHARGAGAPAGAADRAAGAGLRRLPGAGRRRVHARRHAPARAVVRRHRQRRGRLHAPFRARAAHACAARIGSGPRPSCSVGSDGCEGRGASLCRPTPASRAGRAYGPDPRPWLPSHARRPSAGPRSRCRRQARGDRFDRGAFPRDPMSAMNDNEYLFTSESVTEGHPDKIADQISDGVLDAVMRDDPTGRVACETLVNTGLVVVSGEITTETYVDIQDVARETIRKIGYTDADLGFSADSCAVINAIDKQSPDIAQGVDSAYETRTDPSDDDELDVAGAGDQGMMFGYATRETEELMPLPISLAHKLAHRLAAVRHADLIPYLRPDGKTQVSVRYRDGRPVEIEKLLISTQHKEGAETLIPDDLWEHVVEPILPRDLYDARKLRKNFLVNPTGRFVIGGPVGDAGLTGRKIIVDTYGGMARHGGGAFSRQGPEQGRPQRRLRRPLRGQERGRRGAGRPLRGAGRVRDRRRAPGVGDGRDVRDRGDRPCAHPRADPGALRPAPGRLPPVPEAAPADLSEDGGLRPLRPRGPRLHVGEDRQGGRPARSRRPRRRCRTRGIALPGVASG